MKKEQEENGRLGLSPNGKVFNAEKAYNENLIDKKEFNKAIKNYNKKVKPVEIHIDCGCGSLRGNHFKHDKKTICLACGTNQN